MQTNNGEPHGMITRNKILLGLGLGLIATLAAAGGKVAPAPNSVEMTEGYKDWRVISVSHRTDNNTMRVILGNDAAIVAARANQINPWPDGAILAKVVWRATTDKHWDKATVPGNLVHAEFMVKDARNFAATGGWGYARWTGMDQKPYGKDANFASECVACHTPVRNQDWVYTRPAILP
jgi:hypothetical protein